jgi:hypothetical protein
MRASADFRGTITYASLNAHLKIVQAKIVTFFRTYLEGMIYGAFFL